MNFEMTKEQQDIQKMVRDFAEKVVAPTAAERDEKEYFPREIFNEMGQLGIMGLPYPEEYGGAGSDFLSCLVKLAITQGVKKLITACCHAFWLDEIHAC